MRKMIAIAGALISLTAVSGAETTETSAAGVQAEQSATTSPKAPVVDGIVMPRRPVTEAIAEAMQFLKKADGGYAPGKIDGELAGYFTSAFVNEDGSRSDRPTAFPARQHAYFIFTFLRYGAYSGEKEWLIRARDLADWNLGHSTPADAAYANLPYSTYSKGKPGGSRDEDSIEPDKAAWVGSAYIALYEATSDTKYLAGAKAIAKTLVARQGEDGSWPFRVLPQDAKVKQEFGGAPVFYVQFFEDLLRHEENADSRRARDKALKLMIDRNIEKNLWGTYHEDIVEKPQDYLSAEPMSFTAAYLFRHGKADPKYIEMGRRVIARMEERLVHTEGHPAAPAPAVSEQAGFQHMMPGHTARYCMALAELYKVSGDQQAKKTAISGINALTYMQSEAGLFRTFFQLVNEKRPPSRPRPNWYSQHLYTVCHVLEAMQALPEIAEESGSSSKELRRVRVR